MPEWLDNTVIVAIVMLIGNQIIEARRSREARKVAAETRLAEAKKELAAQIIIKDAAATVGLSSDAVNLQAEVLRTFSLRLVDLRSELDLSNTEIDALRDELADSRTAFEKMQKERDALSVQSIHQGDEIARLKLKVAALERELEDKKNLVE